MTYMTTMVKWFLTVSLAAGLLLLSVRADAQVLQKLNGLVIRADQPAQKLHVLFRHPVTGEKILKVFSILPNTGFKNVKKLEEIKPNDPVSVDYEEENDGAKLKAVYVNVIRLDKLPFDAKEVRKKFF